MKSARGTALIDIKDGVVKRLGLVKTIVIATSMRADAKMPPADASSDEPFSELAATLTLANGTAHTTDLRFESPDVHMRAAGSLRLDGSAIDLRGDVQLSDTLSQQGGRDLLRYTQDQGRVTLPVSVTGSAQAPVVRVDVAGLAGRALKNKAEEEIRKRLKGLFRR
jgi:AsmA protein